MTSTTRTPGALTVGPLRPVILKLAAPAVAMMACHFCFNLIDAIWVGRLIGSAALAAVSTAGFYVWVLLSLGEMVEVGLIAVAARRHGEGFGVGPVPFLLKIVEADCSPFLLIAEDRHLQDRLYAK